MFEDIPQGMLIMTPNDPFFGEVLHSSYPPGWKGSVDSDFSQTFVCDASTGLLRPANYQDLEEYVLGGEYDEVVGEDEDGWLLQT